MDKRSDTMDVEKKCQPQPLKKLNMLAENLLEQLGLRGVYPQEMFVRGVLGQAYAEGRRDAILFELRRAQGVRGDRDDDCECELCAAVSVGANEKE